MSTTSPSPDDDQARARVPGWAPIPDDELEAIDDPLDDPTTDPLDDDPTADPPTSPPRPSSAPRSTSPDEAELDESRPASSFPGSRPTDDEPGPSGGEISGYLAEELEELGASLFDIAGRGLNRTYRRRTQTESRLWLATEDETEAFGTALARIARRHIPDELAEEGDASDALVLGSIALGYVLRNTAGQEAPGGAGADEPARARAEAAPPPPAQPAPPPPAAAPSPITPDL